MIFSTNRQIDANGRLQIPQAFLERIGAQTDDYLELHWDSKEQRIIITFELPPERLEKSEEEDYEPMRMVFTEWGFPQLVGGPPWPEGYDSIAALKESREERMDKINGLFKE